MTSKAREGARFISNPNTAVQYDDADLKRRVAELEAIVATHEDKMNELAASFQHMFDSLSEQIQATHFRTLANERMISVKTIETLTRAQVARIMKEESGQ